MKKLLGWVVLLFLILPWAAIAEEAPEITKSCDIKIGSKKLQETLDRNYTTHTRVRKGAEIVIDGGGQELSGVFLKFFDQPGACRIDAEANGQWREVDWGGTHLTDWFPLPEGTVRARVVNISDTYFELAELYVYGAGDRPAEAARWSDARKADLLLVSCHPDDELLWFGGLLPTYAGERGWSVQVAVTVPSMPYRRLELLDGLWHCGVTNYPVFMGFRDVFSYSLHQQYQSWSASILQSKITEAIRRFRPEVVVTHDLGGEYGHGGHKAVADCTAAAVAKSADAREFSASARQYGAWQVKKFYIHSYPERQIQLDWHQPLSAFGGKDGLRVATEALAFHRSQTKNWSMEDGGPHDNSLFGLYMTTVGDDEAGDDLMEHIPFVGHHPEEDAEELPPDQLVVDEKL